MLVPCCLAVGIIPKDNPMGKWRADAVSYLSLGLPSRQLQPSVGIIVIGDQPTRELLG